MLAIEIEAPDDDRLAWSPGLRAVLVYLRPAPRRQLLSPLADLGVFVAEYADAADALHDGPRWRADLVVVVGGEDRRHVQLASDLRLALAAVLVAIVPVGISTEPYLAAGASACIPDDEISEGFAALIEPVARQARELRARRDDVREFIVFKDILFRMLPGELAKNGRSIPLTDAEKTVLLHLARSLGQPVAANVLERRVTEIAHSASRGRRVNALILQLRRKVDRLGGDPALLATIRRFGYILLG